MDQHRTQEESSQSQHHLSPLQDLTRMFQIRSREISSDHLWTHRYDTTPWLQNKCISTSTLLMFSCSSQLKSILWRCTSPWASQGLDERHSEKKTFHFTRYTITDLRRKNRKTFLCIFASSFNSQQITTKYKVRQNLFSSLVHQCIRRVDFPLALLISFFFPFSSCICCDCAVPRISTIISRIWTFEEFQK